jgi:hypothetical protein
VVFWEIQVTVKLSDPNAGVRLKGVLGADCFSDTATDCNASVQKPSYLIWKRVPAFASPKTTSILWGSLSDFKEFTMQYTHDPMYELSNPNGYAGTTTSDYYYLCGG